MYLLPPILGIIAVVAIGILCEKNKVVMAGFIILCIFGSAIVWLVDYNIQTTDYEVWSGRIIEVDHKEEWDEWHPPRTETYTDSDGKTRTRTIPGYWEHHYAENRIKTSDDGWIRVDKSMDGIKFNDRYPNTNEELARHYPIGIPSSSVHTYTNKVQASYSIYKHKEIDLKQYPDLPEYPLKVKNYIIIDRLLGYVPNKEVALDRLAEWNAELNRMVPNPEKPGKMISYKQVNMIFVNVGENKPYEYGFALQDKWENGNKNDFVVAFSMNNDGKLNWVYPFSWSEVETLKINVRDYMMNLGQINDFVPVIDQVAQMVEEQFVRKQFADFNYLQIELSKPAMIIMYIINIIIAIVFFFVCR